MVRIQQVIYEVEQTSTRNNNKIAAYGVVRIFYHYYKNWYPDTLHIDGITLPGNRYTE